MSVTDSVNTDSGELLITCIGHTSVHVQLGNRSLYIDPVPHKGYTYSILADFVLVTHGHADHFDTDVIEKICRTGTEVVTPPEIKVSSGKRVPLKNNEFYEGDGFSLQAVPAYNLLHRAPDGTIAHARGKGKGYILTLGNTAFYFGGDTENIPEMKDFPPIDIAFMRITHPLDDERALEAVRMVSPRILYPYHFMDEDIEGRIGFLKKHIDMEIRLRPMRCETKNRLLISGS